LVAAELPVASASTASDESSLTSSINRERARRGLNSLSGSGELASIARRHSARMAASRRVYHNSSLYRQTAGWTSVAENVGAGPSASAVHNAFMRDSQHRGIILDLRYTDVGVGVSYRGSTIYITEVFARRTRVAPKPRVSRTRVRRRPGPTRAQPAPIIAPPAAAPPAPTVRSVTLILRLLALDEPIVHAPRRSRMREPER
jgi:hypothetical protein